MGKHFPVQDRFAAGTQYVDGRPGSGSSGREHAVVDPATAEPVLEFELAGPEDVDAAVAAAARAFPEWSGATPGERSDAMHRFTAVLAGQVDDFVYAESLQCGKPVKLSAEFDVPGSVDNVSFFAGAARHLEGGSAGEYSSDHTSYLRREPIGVVGSIAPWNYPLQAGVCGSTTTSRSSARCRTAVTRHPAPARTCRPVRSTSTPRSST